MVPRFLPAASVALLASALVAPTAHSATALSAPMAVIALVGQGAGACPASGGATNTTSLLSPASKAQALLGGRVSQLDLIRMQQAGDTALAPPPLAKSQAAVLEPAAGPGPGRFLLRADCAAAFIASVKPLGAAGMLSATTLQRLPASPENFLASKRLEIRRTAFDDDWDRVQRSSLSGSAVGRMLGEAEVQPGLGLLSQVNSWANSRIRYVEDRELYGQPDYWAPASETLRRGAGDCEDIAVAKMQMLAALGVDRSDMYLTLARDLARANDHAVLIVKHDGKSWMLDNSTDQVLDASASYDYRPVFSFSRETKWIHGY